MANPVSINQRKGAYYVRLHVQDKAGVIADITASLKQANVSVETMLQKGTEQDGTVYVVLVTHETTETAMKDALNRINDLSSVIEAPLSIRIEKL